MSGSSSRPAFTGVLVPISHRVIPASSFRSGAVLMVLLVSSINALPALATADIVPSDVISVASMVRVGSSVIANNGLLSVSSHPSACTPVANRSGDPTNAAHTMGPVHAPINRLSVAPSLRFRNADTTSGIASNFRLSDSHTESLVCGGCPFSISVTFWAASISTAVVIIHALISATILVIVTPQSPTQVSIC